MKEQFDRDIHSIAKSLEHINITLNKLYFLKEKEVCNNEQHIKEDAEEEPELQEDIVYL